MLPGRPRPAQHPGRMMIGVQASAECVIFSMPSPKAGVAHGGLVNDRHYSERVDGSAPQIGVGQASALDPASLVEALFEQSSLVLFVARVDTWEMVHVSAGFEAIWGRPREVAFSHPGVWTEFVHEGDRDRVRETCAKIIRDVEPFEFEYRVVRPDGSIRHIRDRLLAGSRELGFIVGLAEDVTDRKRAESFIRAQRSCLERIARGDDAEACLMHLARSVEGLLDRTRASILLLDPASGTVRHIAAPTLPAGYIAAIDGSEIGPSVGSCGTAMHRGERVVVEDVTVDPLWESFRDLAREHGVVACWSQPILASDGRVLGSFALYPSACRRPTQEEIDILETAANLAAIAFERAEVTRALEDRVAERTRELHESESRFRSIVSSVPGVVYRCEMDPQWTMRFISEGVERLTGHSLEEFFEPNGTTWASLIHPADRAMVEQTVAAAVSRDEPFVIEYRLRHRDGRVRWMFEQGRAVRNGDGRVLYLEGVILDATDQHEAADALRESEHRFRVLADDAPMLVWMTGADGRCEFCNRAWREFAGRPIDALLGEGWLECFGAEDRARLVERLRSSEAAAFELECPMIDALGRPRIFLVRGGPRFLAGVGSFEGYVGTALDITGLRATQEAARRHDAELAHRLRLASVGEMASALAHELNQPLAAISNFATGAARRLAVGEIESADVARVLHEIEGLAQRGGTLVHRVRDLVRARTPRGGRVAPGDAVRTAWRMLEADARRAGVRVRIEDRCERVCAAIDTLQLEQVVLNLLRNAIEELSECPPDRRDAAVLIEPGEAGRARIEVVDTGRGVRLDPGELFEPFRTRKPAGVGLGLSISRSIVESYGGRLDWRPNSPAGSCFIIDIPVEGGAGADTEPLP